MSIVEVAALISHMRFLLKQPINHPPLVHSEEDGGGQPSQSIGVLDIKQRADKRTFTTIHLGKALRGVALKGAILT